MVERTYTTPIGFPGTYYQYWDGGNSSARFTPAQGWEEDVYFKSQPNPAWVAIHSAAYQKQPESVRRLKKLDLGNGAFTKENTYVHDLSHEYHITSPRGALNQFYAGPFLPATSVSLKAYCLAQVPWPNRDDINLALNGLGGTAISRTIPTKSNASLAVTLAELRKDGLPKLVGLQLRNGLDSPVKSLAGEYLNYQFGWAPLISDVEKLLVSVRDSRKILEQYQRNSGKSVRRRYQFPETVQGFNYTRANTAGYPASSNEYTGGANGVLTLSGKFTTNAWFSGAYKYLIPVDDELMGKVKSYEREANLLLGTRITPEVIWNATSWTWLLDWFMNVGDIVTNLSYLGKDGLALHYGYVMRHVQLQATATNSVQVRDSSRALSCAIEINQKARRKATPYGFGANPESFTLKQWSILSALGITKVPGKL